jgi:hypothetical protein
VNRLIGARLRDASVIALVPAVAAAFALHNVLIQFASFQLTRDEEFRNSLALANFYSAVLALLACSTLLTLAVFFDPHGARDPHATQDPGRDE